MQVKKVYGRRRRPRESVDIDKKAKKRNITVNNADNKEKHDDNDGNATEQSRDAGAEANELDALWAEARVELEAVLSGRAQPNDDVSPINVLLRVDDDQHQAFAMLHIQRAIRDRRACDAVGLYRAARTLWPESGAFGDDTMPAERELEELRALSFADLKGSVIHGRNKVGKNLL